MFIAALCIISQSVQSLSHVGLFVLHVLQHTRVPCPSTTHGPYSNSCLLSWWCHPTTSYCVVPFSSSSQSFPASGPLQMSQFFTRGGQSTGVSASASVLLMNIQSWFPLGLIGLISLLSLCPRKRNHAQNNTIFQRSLLAKAEHTVISEHTLDMFNVGTIVILRSDL